MRRRSALLLSLTAMLIATGAAVVGGPAPERAAAQQTGFDFSQPSTVATGLQIPWGMAFLPDGSALVAERATARILRISGPGAPPQLVTTVPNVSPDGEGGLLGLAVSPTFAQDQFVYAYHTSPSDNRVIRFPLNSPQSLQPVFTGIPRGTIIHNGGRIAFGPDGLLYVSTGDAGTASNSQNVNSLAGKILRITPTGNVPSGNPFPGSPVYAYGVRNVQGLAWDSQQRLWATEFGQNSFDEVNLIQPGNNYGWPTCEGFCQTPQPGLTEPMLTWRTAESSPSGAAIAGDRLYVAALRGQRLWVVPLQGAGVGQPSSVLNNQFGRLRTVVVGPDGWLWVATSNRDGRAVPGPQDDRILRFPPVGGATTPPTTPPAGGACSATYQPVNEWPGGFQAEVTVTNTSGATASGWRVEWTFPSGQQITQLWGGVHSQTGADVRVDNEGWNGALPPNGSANFGFLGNSQTANQSPAVISCDLQ